MTTDWRSHADCLDHPNPDLWFPAPDESAIHAKRICADCPVQIDCAREALHDNRLLDGIWGGIAKKERHQLRRRLGIREVDDSMCGTEAGLKRHQRRKEKPCSACVDGGRQARRRRDEAHRGA